jgi:hypothetical protein
MRTKNDLQESTRYWTAAGKGAQSICWDGRYHCIENSAWGISVASEIATMKSWLLVQSRRVMDDSWKLVVLCTAQDFCAVGQFYGHFQQVTDDNAVVH